MIDLSKKTYRNILQAQLDRVPNSLDKREGSMIQTALGAGAYSLEEFYQELDRVQRGAYLQTAVGQDLEYLAVLANVQRYSASPAVRLGVFNIDIPIGSRFSTIDGADSANFIAVKKIAEGHFQMTCETPGTIGNQYTGPILPITYIQGLASAKLTDILVAGDDIERRRGRPTGLSHLERRRDGEAVHHRGGLDAGLRAAVGDGAEYR